MYVCKALREEGRMTRVAAEEVQPATGDAPRRERRSSCGAAVRNPRTAGKSRSGMLPIGRPSGDRPPLGGDTVRMRTIWECFYPGATPTRRRSVPDLLKVDGNGVPGVGSGNMPLLIYRSRSSQCVSIHRGAMLPAAAGASIIEESRSAYIVTGSSTGLSVRG